MPRPRPLKENEKTFLVLTPLPRACYEMTHVPTFAHAKELVVAWLENEDMDSDEYLILEARVVKRMERKITTTVKIH